jgi:predicted nucleic acid-binding protein
LLHCAGNPPAWLEVLLSKCSLILSKLDPGESEAISLATELHAEVVLIDEQALARKRSAED